MDWLSRPDRITGRCRERSPMDFCQQNSSRQDSRTRVLGLKNEKAVDCRNDETKAKYERILNNDRNLEII